MYDPKDRATQIIPDLMIAAAAKLRTGGDREVSLIKQSLDVPIEYGPHFIIRSSPHEPPRRGVKSHPLQDSIKSGVTLEPDVVTLTVAAGPVVGDDGEDYAAKLELGGWSTRYKKTVEPRPYIGPSMERVRAGGFNDLLGQLRDVK